MLRRFTRLANDHRMGGALAAEHLLSCAIGASFGSMARWTSRPSASAASAFMAIGATEAVQQAGLRCPNDVSIIGYDDIPLIEHLYPPLPTVAMPVTEVGRVAAETALALVEGRPTAPGAPVTISPPADPGRAASTAAPRRALAGPRRAR